VDAWRLTIYLESVKVEAVKHRDKRYDGRSEKALSDLLEELRFEGALKSAGGYDGKGLYSLL